MKDQITQAEWSILRILWGNDNLTSREIFELLYPTKQWSITTVKTLISRLVTKGYIELKTKSKTPTYYPKYTESDCIFQEMQRTIYKIYGDTKLKESEHFEFYGYPDIDYAQELVDISEKSYSKISKFLKNEQYEVMPWMIHRTLKNFHSAIGATDAPSWLRIGENYGVYHIAPKDVFDNLPLIAAVSFTIAEVMINQINPRLPFYFKQGLATCISYMNLDYRTKDQLEIIIESIDHLTIFDLTIEADQLGEMRHHELSYLFVSYLLSTYGDQVILDVVYNKIKLTEIIFKDNAAFIDKWKSYIINKYKE